VWNFYDFIDLRGANEVREWRAAASDNVRAAFDAKVDILSGIPPPLQRPLVGTISGYPDVYELRFKEDRVQWRVLFCYGPGPGDRDLTFLVAAKEIGDRFVPASAPGTAAERAELVRGKEGKKHVVPHDTSETAADDSVAGS